MMAPAFLWDRALFKTGPDLDQPCPAVIDVTGPMRTLVFGPMVIVPGGTWRLTARFALDCDAADHPYILQYIHGDSLVERRFQPRGAGQYEADLENSFELDAVAALRLWLAEPAFHGQLQFFGASLEARPSSARRDAT